MLGASETVPYKWGDGMKKILIIIVFSLTCIIGNSYAFCVDNNDLVCQIGELKEKVSDLQTQISQLRDEILSQDNKIHDLEAALRLK